jgi:hypothetical protein
MLARLAKLVPCLSHLLKLLAMSGRCGSRHAATFGGVLKVFFDFFTDDPPRFTIMWKAGEFEK